MERLINIISETYVKYEDDSEKLNILIQKVNEIPNILIKMKDTIWIKEIFLFQNVHILF